jgi:acetylornithine deacetylase/succinyl-diaminopimelate desuccinylase-like protein
MKLNDTTRTYFEKLANISPPEQAARYKALFNSATAASAQKYLRENEPGLYSMLRTSVVPTMLKAGVGLNVIPSEAEAILDVRAVPGENISAFYAEMGKVIGDPAVKIVPLPQMRPASPASRLDTEMYRVMEAAAKQVYPGAAVLPSMSTGASDMAQLRAKGIPSYGVGPASTEYDALHYPAHGDVERLSESSLYPFVQYVWTVVREIAAAKK